MTSIERTAYPRFPQYRPLREKELIKLYTPTPDQILLINQFCREQQYRLNFTLFYKTFQNFGYFPDFEAIPKKIVEHIRKALEISSNITPIYKSTRTKRKHQQLIRELLNVSPFDKEARRSAIKIALDAAKTMNTPADIINVVIEKMIANRYELPSFDTLDRLVRHCKARINNIIFNKISNELSKNLKQDFEELIQPTGEYNRTGFNQLKKIPKRTTTTHFNELLSHHIN